MAGRLVLALVKNNLAAPQPSLAYTLRAEGDARPALCWLGPSEYSADQLLLASNHQPLRLPPRDLVRDFLAAFLEDGPRTSRALWEAAKGQGFAERTLYRTRRELAIRTVRVAVETAM
jgi:hypothetical protein